MLPGVTLFQPASSEQQKKLHKAMSSGDLGKVDSLRKNSQDGRFVMELEYNFSEAFYLLFFSYTCMKMRMVSSPAA